MDWVLIAGGVFLAVMATFRLRCQPRLFIIWFLGGWLGAELAWVWAAVFGFLALWTLVSGGIASAGSWIPLLLYLALAVWFLRLHRLPRHLGDAYQRWLEDGLATEPVAALSPERRKLLRRRVRPRDWLRPLPMRPSGVRVTRDIAYGPHERHRLDIYHPTQTPDQPLPVLLQIHGGAWILGNKKNQGLPLMHLLAERGWICVACNYRLAPAERFPAQLEDVHGALQWIRTHIADYGGDPDFIAVTGGSAGGHLASLAALTHDTSGFGDLASGGGNGIRACVPFYGIYDFLDRNGTRMDVPLYPFLERSVMPGARDRLREAWAFASPLSHLTRDAPPFMVIHGSNDSLAFVEEARYFSRALREVSTQPVVYAELERTQHAFDLFHSPRTEHTINAVQLFLEYCYSRYQTP